MDTSVVPYAGQAAVALEGGSDWVLAHLVSTDGNRWSHPGEPTIYLGTDPETAIAELARHVPTGQPVLEASVWTVDVTLDAVVDLTRKDRLRALDAQHCRELATNLRRHGVQGLLVPSVAFLDQPDRANLVVFADAVGRLDRVISDPERCLVIGPPLGRACRLAGP